MPIGNVVATHVQQGAVVNAVKGLVAKYFCDGISRPNPGATKIIIHDGAKFLKLVSPAAGNHSAVYLAVFEALADARQKRAADVEISLASTFVWGQITNNEGVDDLDNEFRKARRLASNFRQVTWNLVEPPFALPTGLVQSLPALRRMAP